VTAAEPFAPLASVVEEESKVRIGAVQGASLQTWKVSLPVSFGSGSAKVAVSVGFWLFVGAAAAGETSAGAVGATLVVELVIAPFASEPLIVWLPAGSAIRLEPGGT
jgi:hypothetical protein